MRLKTPESQRRMAEMQHMRDCGFTLQQIVDQYGISRERVRQIVNNIHKKKRTCGVKNICYPNFKKWALDNGYSTLTKLANDMDMCSSLIRSLLIKGEPPTKRSIRKITEFTGMSADEVFYLPDIAA